MKAIVELTTFPIQPDMTSQHPQFGRYATKCWNCGQMSAIRDRLTGRRECKFCIEAWQLAETKKRESEPEASARQELSRDRKPENTAPPQSSFIFGELPPIECEHCHIQEKTRIVRRVSA